MFTGTLTVSRHITTQDTWKKSITAAARFVLRVGTPALELAKKLESNEGKVSGYTFKVMESIQMQEDYMKVISRCQLDPKLTPQTFQNTVREVIRERYWCWILTHPGLIPDHIHPSRGIHFPCQRFPVITYITVSRHTPFSCSHWRRSPSTGTDPEEEGRHPRVYAALGGGRQGEP
jgi:hypothetical protein